MLAVMFLGATVQGSIGFGMNVLAAPIVVQFEPRLVPIPLLVAALVMSAATAVREREGLLPREVSWALVGRVPGVVIGVLAVAMLARQQLSIILGISVLLAVAVSVSGWHLPVTRRTLVGAGLVSGVMGTATSVGGPPMALLYQHGEGTTVRANLSGFFLVGVALSLALLGLSGEIGAAELRLSAALVPAVLAGFAASGWTRRHVDRGGVRPFVITLSALSAAVLLVRTLIG